MKGLNRDMGMALGRQWHRHRIIENELKTCKAKQQGMALEGGGGVRGELELTIIT